MFEAYGRRLGLQFVIFSTTRSAASASGTKSCLLFERHYSVQREARFLKKLVTGQRNSKKKWFSGEPGSKGLQDLSFLSSTNPTAKKDSRQKSGKVIRRVGVLNTVFMEQITEILASGGEGIGTEIHGLGLEITEVKISPDFSCVNVYWFGTGREQDDKLEPVLKTLGSRLRHVLTQLRVIGVVPPIVFIKDTKYTKLVQVETLLARVDLGEDFVPTDIGRDLRAPDPPPPFPSSSNVSRQLQSEIVSLEEGADGIDLVEETYSPNDMRQDVLGLDHAAVMAKIRIGMSRAKRKLKQVTRAQAQTQASVPPHPECTADSGTYGTPIEEPETNAEASERVRLNLQRQGEFLNYLKKRRITKAKEDERTSTAAREREFLEEERAERWLRGQGLLYDEKEFLPKEEDDVLDEDLLHSHNHQEGYSRK